MERAMMRDRTPIQAAAMLVSIVFVLVGILGFIPGITTDGPGKFSGEDSEAQLLGIFDVSILHNIVHLAFGLIGLAMARTIEGARTFLIGGGVVYLALWLLGMFSAMDWLPADTTDHWLHLGLGVALLGTGLLLSRREATGYGRRGRDEGVRAGAA